MNSTLNRCAGPPCPRCGCQDVRILQMPQSDGNTWYPSGRATCNHCHTRFAFRRRDPSQPQQIEDPKPTELPPVAVQEFGPMSTRVDVGPPSVSIATDPTRCPVCGATAKAYSTKGRTQYRKCPDCGKRFKTLREAG